MKVQQGGKQAARYVCARPLDRAISTKVCWSVSAAAIDGQVAHHFLQAARPPEVELSLAVTREVERQAGELAQLWNSRLERARYEAQLAERRYKAVDPDNRVVARTLEDDWEAKLRALQELEEAYDATKRVEQLDLSDADRAEVLSLARNLPRVWKAASTTNVQRKNLLRLLVQEVALTPVEVPRRMTHVQILWHTGAVTEANVERPRSNAPRAAEQAVKLIRELARQGRRDHEIAAELNRGKILSCQGRRWNAQMVRGIRKRREIGSGYVGGPGGRWPDRRNDGLLSLRGVAKRLGVEAQTVRSWVKTGLLKPAAGGGRGCPLWFRLDAATARRLKSATRGASPKAPPN
jgi:hypothetical protein